MHAMKHVETPHAGHAHGPSQGASCCQSHGQGGTGPLKDPVCGMSVDPARAPSLVHAGSTYYFCCEGCRGRFAADPAKYLAPQPRPAPAADDGRIYTCPMHPEVRQRGPGNCPKCGMALEPEAPSLDQGPDPEVLAMRRRLWIAAALTLPLLAAAMSEMLPGGGVVAAWLRMHALGWSEALLATPVLLWPGAFVFKRGWDSLRQRSPNMWTLIALGAGSAWGYSLLALLFPEALPPAFRGPHGMPPLYFEAAAVIVTLVILGQLLEAARRSAPCCGWRRNRRIASTPTASTTWRWSRFMPATVCACGRARRCRSTAWWWRATAMSTSRCSPANPHRSASRPARASAPVP